MEEVNGNDLLAAFMVVNGLKGYSALCEAPNFVMEKIRQLSADLDVTALAL